MALSEATIDFDLEDLIGEDFDPRRTKVWITTNVPDDTVIDTDSGKIRLGSGNVTILPNGTGSFTTWVPGAGSNPESWQTYVHVDYPDRAKPKGRDTKTFGPFTITGSGDLAALVQQQASPPDFTMSAFLAGWADLTPSLEEVNTTTIPLAQGSSTITAATTVPLHVAMFGISVEQLSLVSSTAVAASDTNYWTIRLVRYRNGSSSNIVTKTTKTTASGGEAFTAFTDWNFDTAFWGATRQLAKGDVLALVLTPTGAPSALTLPSATYRARPDDGATPTRVDIAWDYFARADSTTTLGTSTSGHTWIVPGAGVVFGISGQQAYRVDATAPRGYAWVDSGYSDARVSVDLVVTGATLPGPAFRMSSVGGISGFTTDAQNLYRANADGSLTSLAIFSVTAVQGDNIAIVGEGAEVWAEINGVAVTSPVTDTLNQTSAMHGIRISTASGSYRLDNFLVEA